MTQKSKVIAFKPDSLSLDPWNSHGRKRKMTPINFLNLQVHTGSCVCPPTHIHTNTDMNKLINRFNNFILFIYLF